MDCDGQHEPARIPVLLEAIHDCDIVSGSRYLRDFRQDTPAPTDRRFINATITAEINVRYGLNLTDAFCGFKAYRRDALEKLHITETGWGMPLQLWVQAARQGLRVKEIGVPRLYLDPNRAFGGVMNDPEERLAYYRAVLASAERDALPAFPHHDRLSRVRSCGNGSSAGARGKRRGPGGPRLRGDPGPGGRESPQARPRRRSTSAACRSRNCGALARREVLEAARQRAPTRTLPLLLAGHQPELAHPGVWVKNFALNGLATQARRHAASPHRR